MTLVCVCVGVYVCVYKKVSKVGDLSQRVHFQ